MHCGIPDAVETALAAAAFRIGANGYLLKNSATSELNITPRTVAFHKYQMMKDLDIENKSKLIQYAIKHGIIF